MKYSITAGSRPAYLQLYEQLRGDIVSGVYPHGVRLPSKRLLSEELRVSVATVEHAYALLCEEGYAAARERSGYYVEFRDADGFAAPALVPRPYDAERTAVSDEQGFPFSVLARAMRNVLSGYQERIMVKSPNSGCTELRAAIASYLRRSRGIEAAPEQIIIGSGAEYLYGQIVGLLGRERIYALEDPSYEKIEQVYRAEGARYEMLPLGKDGIESGALVRTQANVLHITPYRSYPSGITASASKRHAYVRWAAAPDRFLVEDDFESEFSVAGKPEETLFALSGGEKVIYLNTFSRTISPSMRAGYMVLPKALAPVYARRLGFYSCTVPSFEQYVLAELLDSGDFERNINRMRRRKRRELSRAAELEKNQQREEEKR